MMPAGRENRRAGCPPTPRLGSRVAALQSLRMLCAGDLALTLGTGQKSA